MIPEWKREPPNAIGHWLRYNAGHRISRHNVHESIGEGGHTGKLIVNWGFGSGECGHRWLLLSHPKLRGWLWYGPIPQPEGEPYQSDSKENMTMKTLLTLILCAFLSLGAAIPCGDIAGPITFGDIGPGPQRHLVWGYGTDGLVTIATLGTTAEPPGCLEVRAIDQTIHADILGERAVAVDEPIIIDFQRQDCWGVTVYLGADDFDADRHPQLQCYAEPGVPTGGDYGMGSFGPEAWIDEEEEYAFLYLFYQVLRYPFGNYVPRPIDYCILEPGGEGVFLSAVHYVVDQEPQSARRRSK